MERTKKGNMIENKTQNKDNLRVYAELVARASLAAKLGYQYGGDRDLYEALGYKTTLSFNDFYVQFRRQDIAKAIVNRPITATWRGSFSVTDDSNKDKTPFEKDFDDLIRPLKLKSVFVRWDKLISLGRYAVLLLGFDDVSKASDWATPVSGGKRRLLYAKPKSENSAQIDVYDKDPSSPRYGLPVLYKITIKDVEKNSEVSLPVHYTRVVHAANEVLEDDIIGTSVLESVFNRLQDLEKLVGSSAEMFWRGARPGFVAKADKEYGVDPASDDDFRQMVDEYEHNLRRILITEGYDFSALASQVSDPKNHVDIQIQMISAVTQIPKRILTGSERGELSSSQDTDNWLSYIQTRREEYAEELILKPFIDICVKHGVINKPGKGDYQVEWAALLSQSEKEKAEIGKTITETIKAYATSGADYILPVDYFLEYVMGFTEEQIEQIKQKVDEEIKEEDIVTPEEENILENE
jgi:uncharacterized protein